MTMTAVPDEAAMPAKYPGLAVMVTDFAMNTGPYPAASRATISPPGSTVPIAVAKLRQGELCAQPVAAFASLPPEATNTRCAPIALAILKAINSATPSRRMLLAFHGRDF